MSNSGTAEPTDLLPCPFCGGPNAEHSMGEKGDGTPYPYVECADCAANAEPEIWNRRAEPSASLPATPECWKGAEKLAWRDGYQAASLPAEPMDAEAWAELYRLREEVQGPNGFATWKEAAVHERNLRQRERLAREALAAPPAAQVDQLREALRDAIDGFCEHVKFVPGSLTDITVKKWERALSPVEQPRPQEDRMTTSEEERAAFHKWATEGGCHESTLAYNYALEGWLASARTHTARAPQPEPVAWRCKDYADGWILFQFEQNARRYQEETGCLMQPLYAARSTQPPEHSALIDRLRSVAAAYPADVFLPLDDEDRKHPNTIQRASAAMGRHMAPLLLEAAAALSTQERPRSAMGEGEVVSSDRAQAERPEAADVSWEPIETAPRDNARPLYLARFDKSGKLQELDYDGGWEYWQESWELAHINGWDWVSACGIEEPTHWAYQDGPPPAGRPEPLREALATALDFFEHYSSVNESCQDDMAEERNAMLNRMHAALATQPGTRPSVVHQTESDSEKPEAAGDVR
jgi:hypothetical protein